jgi:hypothetical protein
VASMERRHSLSTAGGMTGPMPRRIVCCHETELIAKAAV